MKSFCLFTVIICVALIGCGNSNVQNKVAETSGKVDKLERELTKEISGITEHIGDLGGRIQNIESEMGTIKQAIETLSEGEIKITKGGGLEPDEIAEITKNYDNLMSEFESVKEELNKVREQVASAPRVATPDYANDWRDMGDPAKLAAKLDKFTKEYASKLDATGQRSEFEADMESYKAEAAREYTRDELLAKYKESLTRQMQEATDDRMKEWYNRQIQALDEASGDALEARLENYRRYENMRKLSEIGNKYKIPRSEFRNYGMQVYGGTTPNQ